MLPDRETQLQKAWERIAALEARQLKLVDRWKDTLDKYTKMQRRWKRLRLFLDDQRLRAYCEQCAAGSRESVAGPIAEEAQAARILQEMDDLEREIQ